MQIIFNQSFHIKAPDCCQMDQLYNSEREETEKNRYMATIAPLFFFKSRLPCQAQPLDVKVPYVFFKLHII